MGVDYAYVNLDARERFWAGALGGSGRLSALGRGLAGRALGLLITARGGDALDADPALGDWVGRWAGGRIVAAGDAGPPGELGLDTASADDPGRNLFSMAHREFRDVSSSVALMLMTIDGPDDLLDAAERATSVFVLLGDLAAIHRRDVVERALNARFGDAWRRRYREARKENRPVAPPP